MFDKDTNQALSCRRSTRIAPTAHRITLLAGDHGCTTPGCPVPGYGTQLHHTTGWATGGHTNIDQEVLACDGDNHLAEHGWTVTITPGGVQWIHPPNSTSANPAPTTSTTPSASSHPTTRTRPEGQGATAALAGSTRILACVSGSPRASKAVATPSSPTVPVINGEPSSLPSANMYSASRNSSGV